MADTRGVFSLSRVFARKKRGTWVDVGDVYTQAPIGYDTGYFGGGQNPVTSIMDKTTYSSDTTAQVPGAGLSAARSNLAATGNSTAGYFSGGFVNPNYYWIIPLVNLYEL